METNRQELVLGDDRNLPVAVEFGVNLGPPAHKSIQPKSTFCLTLLGHDLNDKGHI
jgi:hypothetical protein